MNPTHPRIRGGGGGVGGGVSGRTHSRNRQWTANVGSASAGTGHSTDTERWERGGGPGRGGGRPRGGGVGGRGAGRGMGLERGGGGRKFPNQTLRNNHHPNKKLVVVQQEVKEADMLDVTQEDDDFEFPEIHEPEFETQEEREKFYQELVKAREVERKKAIAEGKMDDPLVPKRLEDAITMVGTCMDMCPRFERYRRERENNLFEWETIPGTKRVDHKRAVKMYERAAGDKTLPSDLRPPKVLKRTLDYLFHDLLPRGGFSQTYTFIRDRSRAVRNDFTMQHESGPIAVECHDRCARFHILALHFERDKPGFSIALEEQQLMNTLQSLKEFYTDQRSHYTSPSELEMRVYHRLIHIRDQRERHEDVPSHIISHPVFELTTLFRRHVQTKSAPITKTSPLVVDHEGMRLFGDLANVLREGGNMVMIYLVACILERLFGKDTIEDIESIRGELRVQDIIDGKVEGNVGSQGREVEGEDEGEDGDGDLEMEMDGVEEEEEGGEEDVYEEPATSVFGTQSAPFFGHAQPPAPAPAPIPSGVATSAFANLASAGTKSVFGGRTFGATTSTNTTVQPTSVFGIPSAPGPNQQQEQLSIFGAAKRKTLADAPPIGGGTEEGNEIPGLSASPPQAQAHQRGQEPVKSVFGRTFGSVPSPFGAQAQQLEGQVPQAGVVTSSRPLFSGNKQLVLNPSAQAFVPGTSSSSVFGPASQVTAQSPAQTIAQPSANGITFAPTPPPPVPAASISSPAPATFPTTTVQSPPHATTLATTSTTTPLAPQLRRPRKSITPPSLRINTQSFTPPPSIDTAPVGRDGLPIVPIPIPPTPTTRGSSSTAITMTTSMTATTAAGVASAADTGAGAVRSQLQAEPTLVLDDADASMAVVSPTVPPALARRMPVSLPSTPSTSGFAVPHPILGWIGANGESIPVTPTGGTPSLAQASVGMGTPGLNASGSGLGVLSPLDVSFSSGSGTALGFAFGSASPRKVQGQGMKSGASQSLLTSALLRRDKGKGVEVVPPSPSFPATSTTTAAATASSSASAVAKPAPPSLTTGSSTVVTTSTTEYIPTQTELKTLALTHHAHKLLSKTWARWKSKYEDVIAWAEAVQSSDAYCVKKMKMKMKGLTLALRKEREKKRRRGDVGESVESEGEEGSERENGERGRAMVVRSELGSGSIGSPRKRQRKKRISDVFVEPRTDEEIAKRFKENRAENQTLWAQGSYLSTIRAYIYSLTATTKPSRYRSCQNNDDNRKNKPWNIWLSLNPESDSSAIWLERKFDVPQSGTWANENVFEIPVLGRVGEGEEGYVGVNGSAANGKGKAKAGTGKKEEQGKYTGLIVFERTPTDLVKDDIEKKYCILDDCSRLRDIIDALSSKRHYIPSLLILRWGSGEGQAKVAEPDDEFIHMVKKYVDESVLAGYATLGIRTTVNLDEVLSGVLRSIKLDIEGRLVKSTTLRGVFRTFEEEFSNFLIEWLDNCSTNGYFDWMLYAHLVQATIGMLNKMGSLVSAMLSKSKRDLLPSFDVNAVNSSDTAYETAFTWLSRNNDQGDTEKIVVDLQSHINIGQDFPARTFIQHLLELTVLRTEKHTGVVSSQAKQDIPIIDLKAALELFEAAIEPYQTQLSLALNMSVRRSPKRRGMSEETDDASPEAKRLKIAPSFASSTTPALPDVTPPTTPPPQPYLNGKTHSPSPSILSNTSVALTEPLVLGSTTSASLSGSPPKQVTVAMLRALTRDMKRKYGSKAVTSPATPSSYVTRN